DVGERYALGICEDDQHGVLLCARRGSDLGVLAIGQGAHDHGGDHAVFAVAQAPGIDRVNQLELHRIEVWAAVLALPVHFHHRAVEFGGEITVNFGHVCPTAARQ